MVEINKDVITDRDALILLEEIETVYKGDVKLVPRYFRILQKAVKGREFSFKGMKIERANSRDNATIPPKRK